MSGVCCLVIGCPSTTFEAQVGITFHKIPKIMRKSFGDILAIDETKIEPEDIICSLHFEDNQFFVTGEGIKRLMNGSVPCRNLEPEKHIDFKSDVETTAKYIDSAPLNNSKFEICRVPETKTLQSVSVRKNVDLEIHTQPCFQGKKKTAPEISLNQNDYHHYLNDGDLLKNNDAEMEETTTNSMDSLDDHNDYNTSDLNSSNDDDIQSIDLSDYASEPTNLSTLDINSRTPENDEKRLDELRRTLKYATTKARRKSRIIMKLKENIKHLKMAVVEMEETVQEMKFEIIGKQRNGIYFRDTNSLK